MVWKIGVVVLVASLVTGCLPRKLSPDEILGGQDVAEPKGVEGGPCFENRTCNVGLSCGNGVCLRNSEFDKDKDNFVDKKYGGTDCNDDNDQIHPGMKEIVGIRRLDELVLLALVNGR